MLFLLTPLLLLDIEMKLFLTRNTSLLVSSPILMAALHINCCGKQAFLQRHIIMLDQVVSHTVTWTHLFKRNMWEIWTLFRSSSLLAPSPSPWGSSRLPRWSGVTSAVRRKLFLNMIGSPYIPENSGNVWGCVGANLAPGWWWLNLMVMLNNFLSNCVQICVLLEIWQP